MIQKTNISVCYFGFSLGVCNRRNQKQLKGQEDYGQHTLATPTLLRSHVRRGVANMALVYVKDQGVKY